MTILFIYFIAVKGLRILASFPGNFMPVSKSTFENILAEFISVISLNFNNTSLWRSVLNALAEIGSYIEEYHDSEKMPSFDVIVVERMVALLSSDDSTIPLSLKVEAVSEIGKTNLKYMLKIVQELNKAISTSLHGYWVCMIYIAYFHFIFVINRIASFAYLRHLVLI